MYPTTWYDLYHHLVATGIPMVVSGHLPPFSDSAVDWVATPQGLNRYDGAVNTATWNPEPDVVLTTPAPVPQKPHSRQYSLGVKEGKRLALVAVAERIGLSDPDDVHPDEPLGFLTFSELQRLIEEAK
jgi:hypothetical protein